MNDFQTFTVGVDIFKKHTVTSPDPLNDTPVSTVELDMFVISESEVIPLNSQSCFACGTALKFELDADGSLTTVGATVCPVGEITPVETVIPVLSGKLAFSDFLAHDSFPATSPSWDYSGYAGNSQYMRDEAEQNGIAYSPVGNSCPDVWFDEDTNKLLILNFPYDEKALELRGELKQVIPREYKNLIHLGKVQTEVWAYSFMDYEAFLATQPSEELLKSVTVVDVPAGDWKFTHYAVQPEPYFKADWTQVTIFGEAELVTV